VARWWISNTKNFVLNMFSYVVGLVSKRMNYVSGKSCLGMDAVWSKVVACIRRWRMLCKDVHSSMLDRNLLLMEKMRSELPRIDWRVC
jgi:hypothetical protein